jgi:putative SOS response-associated peptidase YedK
MCFGSQPFTGDADNDPNKGMRFVDPAFIDWLTANFGKKQELVYPNGKLPFIHQDADGKQAFKIGNFGLLPSGKSWVKKPSDGRKYYNARAETLFEKPTYKDAAKHRRAIVLARYFYEYSEAANEPSGKAQLYQISREDQGPIPIASIWEQHPEWGYSVSFVTTEPIKQVLEEAHHTRSPLILEPEQIGEWLDRTKTGVGELMRPWAGGKLRIERKG